MATILAFSPVVATRNGRMANLKQSSFRSGVAVKARTALARKAPRSQAVQTVAAKAATKQAYICVDCGYIYDDSEGPFEKLPNSYRCPVCSAPKRRFKAYDGPRGRNDAKSMQSRAQSLSKGSSSGAGAGVDKDDGNFLLILAAGGAVLLGALYFGLSSQF